LPNQRPHRRSPIARLLFCDSLTFWGGGEHWIVQVGSALSERGWEITVAGRHDAELLKRAQSAGLETVAWSYKRDFDLGTMRAASRWIAGNKPDAVLVTTGRDIRTAGLAAKHHRIPVVWRMGPKPKKNIVHRLTGSLIDHVLAPSETVRQEIQPFSWLKNKVNVIPNGIAITPAPTPDQIRAARNSLGVPDSALLCLYVGRLMAGKGIDTLIEAFAEIHKQYPPAILSVIGAGPGEAVARERSAALRLNGVVSFHGYMSDPSYYFDACDLLMLPSRYESFSYVLLEAMLRAKPCITTRAGAIPEVVGEDAAVLIPPGDPAALAQATMTLAGDPDRRSRLGKTGRQRVIDHFDLAKTVDAVESLFRTMIKAG